MKKQADIRLLAIAFLVLAIVLRLVPHGYNLTAIGALGIFVGYYWSLSIGFLFTIAALAISDLIGQQMGIPSMGGYSIAMVLANYSAMGLSAVVGKLIQSRKEQGKLPLWFRVPAGAVVAGILFFLGSNFAAWLDPMMGYPQTFAGLMECYWMAIPFAWNTFAGNLLFSALFFVTAEFVVAPADRKASQQAR